MDYEKEMRGMHKKADFNDAQGEMMGEKAVKGKMCHGGPVKKAAGGVAKMRRGVADESGAPRHMSKKMPKRG